MNKRYAYVLLLVIFSPLSVIAKPQENKPPSPINILTPTTPTISNDTMYALGQQSSQLTSISGRLEKIETKLDSCRDDITRINTIGAIAVLLFTAYWAPIAVERWKHALRKSGAS